MRYKKLTTILAHIFFWLLLIAILYILRRPDSVIPERVEREHPFANIKALSFLPMIALFYIHSYYLVPLYLVNRRYLNYSILTISLLLLIALASSATFFSYAQALGNPPGYIPGRDSLPRVLSIRLLLGIFFLGASTGYGVLRENIRTERRKKDNENEQLRTELFLLRSQINPHFFLNVINSIVALARRRSDKLEPMLLELAGLMTYMLYEQDNEKVPLEDEIEYLRGYVNLQLLRFGDDVNVSFTAEQQPTGHLIEPMLLIPLVENAFKHGIDPFDKSTIEIKIDITGTGLLSLLVKNKTNDHPNSAKKDGIGLTNLKKRLTLIYPGKFQLQTKKEAGRFIASLNLQLS